MKVRTLEILELDEKLDKYVPVNFVENVDVRYDKWEAVALKDGEVIAVLHLFEDDPITIGKYAIKLDGGTLESREFGQWILRL